MAQSNDIRYKVQNHYIDCTYREWGLKLKKAPKKSLRNEFWHVAKFPVATVLQWKCIFIISPKMCIHFPQNLEGICIRVRWKNLFNFNSICFMVSEKQATITYNHFGFFSRNVNLFCSNFFWRRIIALLTYWKKSSQPTCPFRRKGKITSSLRNC
jgi:hypothetical protein